MPEKFNQLFKFWFSPEGEKAYFSSTPETDQWLKDQFLQTWLETFRGDYDDLQTPVENVLKVILMDQIPLNIFRKQIAQFQSADKALQLSKHMFSQDQVKELDKKQQVFIILPYMHSENISDHDLALQLSEQLSLKELNTFAHHHRDIIVNYGRFPHRNEVLGRVSTKEELEYLEKKDPNAHA